MMLVTFQPPPIDTRIRRRQKKMKRIKPSGNRGMNAAEAAMSPPLRSNVKCTRLVLGTRLRCTLCVSTWWSCPKWMQTDIFGNLAKIIGRCAVRRTHITHQHQQHSEKKISSNATCCAERPKSLSISGRYCICAACVTLYYTSSDDTIATRVHGLGTAHRIFAVFAFVLEMVRIGNCGDCDGAYPCLPHFEFRAAPASRTEIVA